MVDEPQKALKKATLIWGCRTETEAKCQARPFPLATQWWVFAASGSWNLKGRAGKKGSVPRSQRTEGTEPYPGTGQPKTGEFSATENGELNSVKQHVSTKIQFISSSCQIKQMGPINRQQEEFVGLHIGHTSLQHHACSSYSMIVGIGRHRKAQKDGHGIDYDCSLCQVGNKICYVPIESGKQNTQPFPNRVYEIECAPVRDDIQWGFATGFNIQPFFGGYCLCGNPPRGRTHTRK
jgi:hypothetical protein